MWDVWFLTQIVYSKIEHPWTINKIVCTFFRLSLRLLIFGKLQIGLIISLFLGAQADRWALYPSTKGKAEEAVKELDFARTSIYRPGLLITERQESRSLEKFGQWVAGFLDTSYKVSIKTEDLAKAMVFNAINKNFEGKTETIEHAAILNISKEATEAPKI